MNLLYLKHRVKRNDHRPDGIGDLTATLNNSCNHGGILVSTQPLWGFPFFT